MTDKEHIENIEKSKTPEELLVSIGRDYYKLIYEYNHPSESEYAKIVFDKILELCPDHPYNLKDKSEIEKPF